MRFSLISTVFLIGTAFAQAKLPANAPCKQDGSLGTCESGLCVQTSDEAQGSCK
ncbi:uncharacterized protein ASPGLDRAFT_52348 [Aspergillus glaucus CBS 516.65]|uniref:Dickkopf N-terminal cysteine-rich domain-containing protein n=1 Tax=Aspergillus glaucus CBS 516.65 TaxID=1160497 RepID=A0A1L9V7C3_ASPGL|nr:hypothetical protein ASPGLDRAFT_52348 [Aspergillus glaucus CBS 516.65]OJJ79806.1 hypothetical protein ASPGLDRAFT_52348 [Aspergillus glaucus CBS 516.65]